MKIESVETRDHDIVVTTTGAHFRLNSDAVDVRTRLPSLRSVGTIQLGTSEAWRVDQWNDDEFLAKRSGQELSIGSDGFVKIACCTATPIQLSLAFQTGDRVDNDLATDLRRDGFGCGLYRLPGTVHNQTQLTQTIDATHPFYFHVFPPRQPNNSTFETRIAHEGRPRKHRRLPSDELIRDVAKHTGILALHAYFWAEEDSSLRPKLSRYRFRKCPWLSKVHVPEDETQLRRVMATAKQVGMKFLPYVSPRYSGATDILSELRRLTSRFEFDGFYLDGLRGNFVEQRDFIRALRKDLGPNAIIYLNGSIQPFGSAKITAPFIDTHCDYVLRGDSGRGGFGRDEFLRRCVSGQGAGNQVGVWCHYGSSGFPFPFDRVPSASDQRAAHKFQVQLWRRSFWWPGQAALQKFDHLQSTLK